jgi:hypothetical protein
VSNVNQVRLPAAGGSATGGTAPSGTSVRPPTIRPPAAGAASNSIPSAEGTAVLNLTSEQLVNIRKLLMGMRYGKDLADDVRSQIFALLNRGQRRVLAAAWFILSVRA